MIFYLNGSGFLEEKKAVVRKQRKKPSAYILIAMSISLSFSTDGNSILTYPLITIIIIKYQMIDEQERQ